MNDYTTRCHYCGELFTNAPVEHNGHKYCTTICKKWDEENEQHTEHQYAFQFHPPADGKTVLNK